MIYGADVADLARKMKDLDIGALPVGENDRLIGMVTDRDITCRAVPNGKDFTLTAREVMSKGIVFCTEKLKTLSASWKKTRFAV